ncbi:MAG: hypothetical protein ACFCU1_00195 [Sumerlaeia bacterium]
MENMQKSGTLIPLDFGSVGIFRETDILRKLIGKTRDLYKELLAKLED